jgi:hypothetical protein
VRQSGDKLRRVVRQKSIWEKADYFRYWAFGVVAP